MCKLTYQYSTNNLPKALINVFECSNHAYPTRNSNIPTVLLHRSTIYNNSYVVKGTTEWRKIPNVIKTKKNVKTFAKHLKKRLLQRQIVHIAPCESCYKFNLIFFPVNLSIVRKVNTLV